MYMARRFKTATMLNFVGLVVAFTAFYLFMTQVIYNAGYNRGIPDAERILRVEAKMNAESPWGIHTNRPILEMLMQIPEVESGTFKPLWSNLCEIYLGNTPVECTVTPIRSETSLLPFSPVCVDGKLTWDSPTDKGILISESMALKFLGTPMAAGRFLWNGQDSLRVMGVYRDFPNNCFLLNGIYSGMGDEGRNSYSEWSYNGYLRLYTSVDVEAFRRDFKERAKPIFRKVVLAEQAEEYENATEEERADMDQQIEDYFGSLEIRVTPITETYFSGVDPSDTGNRTVHLILIWTCLIVLLVAAINFLNFTLAESPMRVKGVNTRRVLGCDLMSLRLSLIGEAVVTSFLALVLSLGVIYLLSIWPTVATLFSDNIALRNHLQLIGWMALIAVAIGIVVGVYPAWFVTSFQPALALKGAFGLTPKGRNLRTVLIALQLFFSLILVIYIGILYLQSHFIYHSDYGFDKNEVCYAHLSDELKGKKDAIRAELLQMGGVEDVAYSRVVLGSQPQYMMWGRGNGDKTVTFTCFPVDCHYLQTMGINVIEGRDFNEHDSDCYIINEAARKRWSWVEMNKPLTDNDNDMPVIGVCENIRYASVHQDRDKEPVAFIIMGENYAQWGDQLEILNVRIGAGIDKVAMRRQLQEKLASLGGGSDVEVRFLDQEMERLYQEEFRFIRQVLLFSVICLVITLIGVFCLTMFETEYRRKEIGIRKVMGSSTREILLLFCRRYAWLIVGCFVVAAPIAWHIGKQWLQGFAERTPIYWWLFPLALLVVGVITLATVVIQSWRMANENPVNCIKNE